MSSPFSMARPMAYRIPHLLRPHRPPCPQYRLLSTSPISRAQRVPRMAPSAQRVGQSIRGMNKANSEKSSPEMFPNDIGILPETFVRPSGKNLPSIFSRPRDRLQLEWINITSKIKDLGGRVIYKYQLKKTKPRPKLMTNRALAKIAQDLYERMYAAVAKGDLETLSSVCGDGLFKAFRARIVRRAALEKVWWKLHEYRGRSRVVANRAARIPANAPGFGIRQVVVRIRSNQSIERMTPTKGNGKSQPPKEADPAQQITENVVLQRMMLGNVEGDWIVWGMIDDSTLASWEKEVEFKDSMAEKMWAKTRGSGLG